MIICPSLDLEFWEVSNPVTNQSSDDYYTKGQIDHKLRTLSGNLESDIDEAVSGKQETLVSGVNIKTLNGESLLGEGDIEISGGVVDAYSKAETDQLLSQKADVSSLTVTNTALSTHTSNTDVHTSAAEKQAWNNKLDASALTAYSTTQQMNTAIESATSGLAATSAISANYYDKTTIDARDGATAQALIDLNANKQDVLVSGTNIKTINNISLLGSGNIDISSSTFDAYTKAETNALLSGKTDTSSTTAVNNALTAHTTDSTVHVTSTDKSNWNAKLDASALNGYATESWTSGFTYDKNTIDEKVAQGGTFDPTQYYNKTDVDGLLSAKTDTSSTTAVNNALTAHTADSTVHVTSTDKTNWNAKLDASALNGYATESYVNGAVSGKSDTSATTAVNNALTAHTADSTVHVTSTDKTNWNAKLDASALNGYATESYVNGAVSAKTDTSSTTAVNNALTAHTADSTVHVTSADKSSWNGAATNASAAVCQLNGYTIVSMTKSDYDLLPTKDAHTIYFLTT